jgi:hypothetical protein
MNEDIPLPVDLPAAPLKSARRRVPRLQTVNNRFESARIQRRANGEGPQTTHPRRLVSVGESPEWGMNRGSDDRDRSTGSGRARLFTGAPPTEGPMAVTDDLRVLRWSR